MKQVRKAVIPAAGLGTRFLPATKAQPKEMLPIVDVPAIQLTVEEAAASGVGRILIVTGRTKRAIEDHFDRSLELEVLLRKGRKLAVLKAMQRLSELADLCFVRQKEPLGLGHAVLCAKNYVGAEPFAVLLGDDLIRGPEPALAQLLARFRRVQAPVVAVTEVDPEHIERYGVIRGRPLDDGLLQVEDIVEKPPARTAPSNLAVVGRYILTPAVFGLLEVLAPGVGGEIQLTDALRALCHKGPVYACRLVGRRYDLGDKLGYLEAVIDCALERPDLGPQLAAYLRGRLGAASLRADP